MVLAVRKLGVKRERRINYHVQAGLVIKLDGDAVVSVKDIFLRQE